MTILHFFSVCLYDNQLFCLLHFLLCVHWCEQEQDSLSDSCRLQWCMMGCLKLLASDAKGNAGFEASFFLTNWTFLTWHQKESKVVEVLSRERNSQSTICLFQVISNSYTQGQDCVDPPLHLRPCTVPVDGSNSEQARLSNSRWSCSYKGGKRATHFLWKVSCCEKTVKRNVRIIIITTAMILQAIVIIEQQGSKGKYI